VILLTTPEPVARAGAGEERGGFPLVSVGAAGALLAAGCLGFLRLRRSRAAGGDDVPASDLLFLDEPFIPAVPAVRSAEPPPTEEVLAPPAATLPAPTPLPPPARQPPPRIRVRRYPSIAPELQAGRSEPRN
jgi:hypothetical protein